MPATRRHAPVTDELRRAIRSGELAPGSRLPSETALMAEYGVARMTARSILDPLVDEGLAYRVHGSGTFVGAPAGTVAVVVHLATADHARLVDAATVAELDPAAYALRAVLDALG